MTRLDLIQWIAAAAGVAGTAMLAEPSAASKWAFLVYLASNVGWLLFAWRHRFWPLFIQTVAFAFTSMWGAWRWILQPALGNL